VTEKQKKFIEVLFDEAKGNVRLAMKIAGYSPTTPTLHVTKPLAEEIHQATKEYISRCATPAAYLMGQIITGDSPLLGQKEKMVAAKDILDRAGLSKTEKVEVTSKDPLFILPPKKESDE